MGICTLKGAAHDEGKQKRLARRPFGNTVLLTINGETKSVAEWCEIIEVSPYTVYWWVKAKGKEYAEKRLFEIA